MSKIKEALAIHEEYDTEKFGEMQDAYNDKYCEHYTDVLAEYARMGLLLEEYPIETSIKTLTNAGMNVQMIVEPND